MQELKHLEGKDFNKLKAKEFSDLVISNLKKGFYRKEVGVSDRGDGRKGRVDLVYYIDDKMIAIEMDRLKPRIKSIFKLKQIKSADERYIITRSPFKIHQI